MIFDVQEPASPSPAAKALATSSLVPSLAPPATPLVSSLYALPFYILQFSLVFTLVSPLRSTHTSNHSPIHQSINHCKKEKHPLTPLLPTQAKDGLLAYADSNKFYAAAIPVGAIQQQVLTTAAAVEVTFLWQNI